MSAPRYRYTITTDDLVKSKNSDIAGTVATRGSVCYTRDSADSNALDSLLLDTARQTVAVNDKLFVDNEKLTTAEQKKRFDDFLHSNFKPENIEKLEKHYSQRPVSIGVVAFADHLADEKWKPRLQNFKANLYEENGVVYLTASIENYLITRKDNPAVELGSIPGPLEAKFMLTENGFELQSISTNSVLLHDLYLGSVSEERILRACVIPEVETTLKTQFYKVAMPESSAREKLELPSLQKARELIQDYKENKIDLKKIQEEFTGLIKTIDANPRFGVRRLSMLFHHSPTTRDILIQSLAKLQSTSDLIPKTEQTSQIRAGQNG